MKYTNSIFNFSDIKAMKNNFMYDSNTYIN